VVRDAGVPALLDQRRAADEELHQARTAPRSPGTTTAESRFAITRSMLRAQCRFLPRRGGEQRHRERDDAQVEVVGLGALVANVAARRCSERMVRRRARDPDVLLKSFRMTN
jgi:hypothetical protein